MFYHNLVSLTTRYVGRDIWKGNFARLRFHISHQKRYWNTFLEALFNAFRAQLQSITNKYPYSFVPADLQPWPTFLQNIRETYCFTKVELSRQQMRRLIQVYILVLHIKIHVLKKKSQVSNKAN